MDPDVIVTKQREPSLEKVHAAKFQDHLNGEPILPRRGSLPAEGGNTGTQAQVNKSGIEPVVMTGAEFLFDVGTEASRTFKARKADYAKKNIEKLNNRRAKSPQEESKAEGLDSNIGERPLRSKASAGALGR